MAVSIVSVSGGLKELTKVSDRVWSESDCTTNIIIYNDTGGIKITTVQGRMKFHR